MYKPLALMALLSFISSCEYYRITTVTPPSAAITMPATESTALCELNFPGGSADPSGFWSGAGTVMDPYKVCTANQLNRISINYSANSHFLLINNIDLTFLSTPFNQITLDTDSSLNGQGYKIIKLNLSDAVSAGWGKGFVSFMLNAEIKNIIFEDATIYFPEASGVALIADSQSATIKNITATNLKVTGKNNVGGVAGYIRDTDNGMTCLPSVISNVIVDGEIHATNTGVAGIVANIEGYCDLVGPRAGKVIVETSSFSGSVSAANHVAGGIVGVASMANVVDVLVNANISGRNAIGGIIGEVFGDVDITNGVAHGTVVGEGDVGGVCGNSMGVTHVLNSSVDNAVTSVSEGGRLYGSFSSNVGSTSVGTTSTGTLNGNPAGLLIGYEYP
jgi:hypothetical protein